MNFSRNKILFLLFTAILVGIFYYRNHSAPIKVRKHYSEQTKNSYNRESMFKTKVIKEKSPLNEVEEAKKSDAYNKEEFNQLMSDLTKIERSIKDREKICAQTISETLPDDDYIDINDEMYDEVTNILEAFVVIVNGAMFRPEVKDAYKIINTLVEEQYPIDPIIMYNRLERLDICRDPKALNFVDTVFEAFRAKKWPENTRNKLIEEVFNLLDSSIAGNKSIENLLYFNNLVLIMADNTVIPKTYNEDLEDLGRRMNENHNLFKEGFGPRETREANLIALGDYLRRNEEYASDILQIVSDISEQIQQK